MATAPASSGNLGPGFDCVALALELRCRVEAEVAGSWTITELGETKPASDDDFVVRAVRMVVEHPMHLVIDNDIPRSRGLGSSSAVAAAAAGAARRAVGEPDDLEVLFDAVCRLEGHGDNAAAAVFGGLVLTSGHGVWRHLELSPALAVVVAVPDETLPTPEARAALPPRVPLDVVVRSLARVGFLVEGLRTADPAALAAAGGDEIHEPPRQELAPRTGELMDAGRAGGALHVAWSGAGPSVVALCVHEAVPDVVASLEKALDGRGEVLRLTPATVGVV